MLIEKRWHPRDAGDHDFGGLSGRDGGNSLLQRELENFFDFSRGSPKLDHCLEKDWADRFSSRFDFEHG
jgi:hypothetical protein